MQEIEGNIWGFHAQGHWIVITTNGDVKSNGEAVMGRGIALEAKRRFPALPQDLGKAILFKGSRVWSWPEYKLVTFPTKHHWREKSDMQLIGRSCQELVGWLDAVHDFFAKELKMQMEEGKTKLYLPRPGCGSGGLSWSRVKPAIEKYLDDRFVVVARGA